MEADYEFESLSQWFTHAISHHPDRVAIVGADERKMTYREVDEVSQDMSLLLRDGGVCKSAKVVIYLDRCVEFVLSYLAILKAGR